MTFPRFPPREKSTSTAFTAFASLVDGGVGEADESTERPLDVDRRGDAWRRVVRDVPELFRRDRARADAAERQRRAAQRLRPRRKIETSPHSSNHRPSRSRSDAFQKCRRWQRGIDRDRLRARRCTAIVDRLPAPQRSSCFPPDSLFDDAIAGGENDPCFRSPCTLWPLFDERRRRFQIATRRAHAVRVADEGRARRRRREGNRLRYAVLDHVDGVSPESRLEVRRRRTIDGELTRSGGANDTVWLSTVQTAGVCVATTTASRRRRLRRLGTTSRHSQ